MTDFLGFVFIATALVLVAIKGRRYLSHTSHKEWGYNFRARSG